MKIEVGDCVVTSDEFGARFVGKRKGIVIETHYSDYYGENSVTVYWLDYGYTSSGVREGYVERVN